MCWDLENGYVMSCPECQHNKSTTVKPIGPLHPLLIPDQRGDSCNHADDYYSSHTVSYIGCTD